MAKKTIVTLVDDLDGTELDSGNGRTLKFSIDGANYEIDLSHEHIREFTDLMDRYVQASRRAGVTGSRAGRPASGQRRGPNELQEIRDWARQHGFQVSDRGRVSNEIIEAYQQR